MCLGIPGQIVEISNPEKDLAIVEFSGVRREVNITCVKADHEALESLIGSWVLVHVGFALGIIDETEARTTLELLAALGEAQQEMEAIASSKAALEFEHKNKVSSQSNSKNRNRSRS